MTTTTSSADARTADRDRGSAAVLGLVVLFLVPALVMVLIAGFSAAESAATNGCSPSSQQSSGTTGRTLTLGDLGQEQLANATTIVHTAANLGLPPAAAKIAITVAMRESTLRNLTWGDRDSVGLFQQRAAWGSYAQRTDPVSAATMFYTGGHGRQPGLTDIRNWQSMPPAVAAQKVQRSAAPKAHTSASDAYAVWTAFAADVVDHLWVATTRDAPLTTATTGGPAAPTAQQCPGSDQDGSTDTGTGAVPAGLIIDGTPAGQKAVRFALAQLGKPYLWGATGPNAFDCSGLTMTAWASAGQALLHFTGDQVHAGTNVPGGLNGAVAGDLVFIPGSDGTIAAPRHVGMVIGYVQDGGTRRLWIVHAPHHGQPVQLTPASKWAATIAAVRHIA